MEQNKEMTASESLALIAETMNNSRKGILRSSAKHFMLWGALLTLFSLLVYFLWKTTDNAVWNNLWFAMPLLGFPLARLMRSKEKVEGPENFISHSLSGIWGSFCIFACGVALFSVLFGVVNTNANALTSIVVGASMSAQIVLLFGLAETITGVVLKNWVIKIAGILTGIGGVIVYYVTGANKEQMFLFTFAGIVLFATGLIVKKQSK